MQNINNVRKKNKQVFVAILSSVWTNKWHTGTKNVTSIYLCYTTENGICNCYYC